jgi:hypothetical protein
LRLLHLIARPSLGLLTVLLATTLTPPATKADEISCTFTNGFEALRDLLPQTVGDCLEQEMFDPETGTTQQATTGGLLVWREADNLAKFTDGSQTWMLAPGGLVSRANSTPRLAWEAEPGPTREQTAFIQMVAEPARQSQRATGVPASVTIAQAILESSWGESRLAWENNNYFGIKAWGRPGSAGEAWYDVWEVVDGEDVIQSEPFRAYNELAESFVDHGRLFQRSRRYAAALAVRDDPRQFAYEISQAGYATDPGYASKLIDLMDRFKLYAYD